MNRKQYNILLNESDVYEKRVLDKNGTYNPENDYIYRDTATHKVFEIMPNELSAEEINTALLARQNIMMKSIKRNMTILTLVIVIPIILSIILLIVNLICFSFTIPSSL